jgi:hypothetical protein
MIRRTVVQFVGVWTGVNYDGRCGIVEYRPSGLL